ncbi:MAG TPA: hypothetical protein PK246_02390, partial [Saprospiraceae bacterium]|nr:hypothetical protein [Saprospiraceae bacterium]
MKKYFTLLTFFILGNTFLSAQDCQIFIPNITMSECENGTYGISFTVLSENVNNDYLDVYLNNIFVDYYENQGGVTNFNLTGIESNIEIINTIKVCVNDNENCCYEISYTNPCICGIWNTDFQIVECNNESDQFHFWLDFNYQMVSDSFQIGGNAMNLGTFAYADLPVLVGPITMSSNSHEYLILDNDDSFCFGSVEIPAVTNCEFNCSITDLTAQVSPCDATGKKYVILNFNSQNTSIQGFKVVGNGNEYGTFKYGNEPYVLGPFESNCDMTKEFLVMDLTHPDCTSNYVEIDPICCENNESCSLTNVQIDPLECDGDGTYSLVLDFDYQGVNNDYFEVWGAGEYLGYFPFSELPVTIHHFPEREVEYDIIKICVNDQPDCCVVHEFIGLNCMENNGECQITDVFAEAYECNDSTNLVYVDIAFNYTGVSDAGFTIRGNGHNYGNF